MDGLPENQTPSPEPRKNGLLEEFEFGVGGIIQWGRLSSFWSLF